jgi:hypothetical protein
MNTHVADSVQVLYSLKRKPRNQFSDKSTAVFRMNRACQKCPVGVGSSRRQLP